MKFRRSVLVEITPAATGKTLLFSGLRVKFNVTKTLDIALNSGTIQIYNLAPNNRNTLSFKYGLHLQDPTKWFGGVIKVYAGYGDDTKLLFSGDILSANTVRVGGDYLTTIEAKTKAEALATKNISKTFPAGTTHATMLKAIIEELDIPGALAELKGWLSTAVANQPIKSGETLDGPAISVLQRLIKRFDGKISFSFDEQGANVRPEGSSRDVVPKFFFNKYSGLIGTPSVNNQGVTVKVLLEPTIRVGNLVYIESNGFSVNFERLFVVRDINHGGDSREGESVTNLVTVYQDVAPLLAL